MMLGPTSRNVTGYDPKQYDKTDSGSGVTIGSGYLHPPYNALSEPQNKYQVYTGSNLPFDDLNAYAGYIQYQETCDALLNHMGKSWCFKHTHLEAFLKKTEPYTFQDILDTLKEKHTIIPHPSDDKYWQFHPYVLEHSTKPAIPAFPENQKSKELELDNHDRLLILGLIGMTLIFFTFIWTLLV